VPAFNHSQLAQIKLTGFQLPHHLRGEYLRHLSELLPKDYGDADVWRAAHRAVREVMRATEQKSRSGGLQGFTG
jgi:hypothetical protein